MFALVLAGGCGEEIDVALILPPQSPCYNPQTSARSILIRVVANQVDAKYQSCFATDVPLTSDRLHEAIASRGPLASGISTDDPLVAIVMTFEDQACRVRQVCFSAPIGTGAPRLMIAACNKTGWAACPGPPLPPR